jgi:transposase
MASNDPAFEEKADRRAGPVSASASARSGIVRGRETAIQALDSKDSFLPPAAGAGRAAWLRVRATRNALALPRSIRRPARSSTASRHTSQEFVAFLTDIVVRQSKTREIHIVLDNLSAQKTRRVVDFLEAHPNVQLNFTPTYSSWLNQVELWFAKIERDLIYRGVFTSVTNLARRIMKYIRRYDKQPDRHPCRGVRHTSTQQLAPCGLSC